MTHHVTLSDEIAKSLLRHHNVTGQLTWTECFTLVWANGGGTVEDVDGVASALYKLSRKRHIETGGKL